MEKKHENMHVFTLLCKFFESTKTRFHVNFLFSAHFYPYYIIMILNLV